MAVAKKKTAKKKAVKTGRPSGYKSTYPRQAAKLCELGATDQDLADFFEVTTRTIARWKVEHAAFCHALSTSKPGYDDQVERSLAMRAIGYSHPDVHISVYEGVATITPYTKHYPPDTKAALAWLYNRRGDKWHPQPQDKNSDAGEKLIEALKDISKSLPD